MADLNTPNQNNQNKKNRRARNWALAGALALFVIVVYFVSIARMGGL